MTIHTSKDVLLSAINTKLGVIVNPAKYDLTNIQPTEGSHNTSVDIVPIIGSGGYNTSLFRYNRMDLAGFGVVPVKLSSASKVSDIVGVIADSGGIYTMLKTVTAGVVKYEKVGITAADLIEGTLPILAGAQTATAYVEAKESSYLFYGILTLALVA